MKKKQKRITSPFTERLKKYKKSHNWVSEQLRDELNKHGIECSVDTVNKWLNGQVPHRHQWVKFEEMLNAKD